MCLETKAFIGQVSATLNCKYMCKIETDWLMCLLSQKNINGTTQQFCVGKSTKKKWKLWMTLILTCICYQFPFLLMYICTIDFFFCTCGLAFTFIVFEHLCSQYVLQLRNLHQGDLGHFFSADNLGRVGVIFSSIFYCNSTNYYRESQACHWFFLPGRVYKQKMKITRLRYFKL